MPPNDRPRAPAYLTNDHPSPSTLIKELLRLYRSIIFPATLASLLTHTQTHIRTLGSPSKEEIARFAATGKHGVSYRSANARERGGGSLASAYISLSPGNRYREKRRNVSPWYMHERQYALLISRLARLAVLQRLLYSASQPYTFSRLRNIPGERRARESCLYCETCRASRLATNKSRLIYTVCFALFLAFFSPSLGGCDERSPGLSWESLLGFAQRRAAISGEMRLGLLFCPRALGIYNFVLFVC